MMTETSETTLISRNISIAGRRTSIRLEPELWDALRLVCRMEGKTINQLCTTIACAQSRGGFTSAVRAYIVRYLVARYYLVQGSVNHHRRPMQATA
jgi:predicted DNA-binding ribbon-helix-helix protein